MLLLAPGVWIDCADGSVYIIDAIGEVCCWTADEFREENGAEALVAAITAVALATALGPGRVRKNILTRGATLRDWMDTVAEGVR